MANAYDTADSNRQANAVPAGNMVAMADRVRVGQFAALNRQGRITNLTSPLIAAVVGLVMWPEVGPVRVLIWFALILFSCVLRSLVHYGFGRREPALRVVPDSIKWAFLVTIFLSGLAWGGGILLLFSQHDPALQSFLIVVVLGMGAGATASFGPYFPALAVYAVPLTVPISMALLIGWMTNYDLAFGFFGLVFLVVLLLIGSAAHRNFASSVRLEYENAFLTGGLEDAQRRLGDAVDSMSEALALFDADDRLVLANDRLRKLVPQINNYSRSDISYDRFVDLFSKTILTGAPQERIQNWVAGFKQRHRTMGEPYEVELADGQWLRVSERSTSDGGVVSIFSDLTQLKIREAALAKSEQRFRDFTEAASDWAWELDADLRFTTVSGRYSEVSGHNVNFLIGKKITDLPSLEQDSDWQTMVGALDQRQAFHNCRLIRPGAGGEPFQFLCSGVPITSDGGTFTGFRGTGSDITAVLRAEALASEAQKQLFDAIESINAGFILFDKEGRLVLWNSKAPEFIRTDPQFLRVGARLENLVRSGADSDEILDARGNREGWIADQIAWFYNPDRTREQRFADGRYIQQQARRTADGGIVAILMDVTAERTAAIALEESEERYRQLVEHSPDLISIHKGGRFVFINPAGARMLRVSSPEELIGRRVLEFIHSDFQDYMRASKPTVETDGLGGAASEFRVVRADGTGFDAEGISLEFHYGGGPAILGILRDITLRKLAQAQLVQTSKLATLGEMAAGITHELNQPLNVIRMAADSSVILMDEGKADRAFERQQFERISEHAVRMANIVSHMRAFSRREDDDSGDELIDPLACVVAAVSMVRDQYARDDVQIELELPEKSPAIYGNSIRLEQVILNLLANARDALVLDKVDPESGRTFQDAQAGHIRVSVHVDRRGAENAEDGESSIVIRIDDDGDGIPADDLDRVFDPFFTTKRTGQGTGLGLAIGYNIVAGMGGRIEASNRPDGARLEVWLPVAGDAETAETQVQVRPPNQVEVTS